MMILGGFNKVSIDALRSRRLVGRLWATTVIWLVAHMIRGMRFSTWTNDGAKNGREKYCNQCEKGSAAKHSHIVLRLPALSQGSAQAMHCRVNIRDKGIGFVGICDFEFQL